MSSLWDHTVAVTSKWIALEVVHIDPERAFLAGLLHNIGRALALRVLG